MGLELSTLLEIAKVLGPFLAFVVPLIAAFYAYKNASHQQQKAGSPAFAVVGGALASEKGIKELVETQAAHVRAITALTECNKERGKEITDAIVRTARALEEILHILKTRD